MEEKINSTGKDTTSTYYYDKTTGLLLKIIINDIMTGYGQKATYKAEKVLSATNMPLVGLKT